MEVVCDGECARMYVMAIERDGFKKRDRKKKKKCGHMTVEMRRLEIDAYAMANMVYFN